MKERGIEELEALEYINHSWIGVDKGTGCCIYSNFSDDDMSSDEFVNFIDYNVHNLNVKGGYVKNRYDLIIIISTIPLD